MAGELQGTIPVEARPKAASTMSRLGFGGSNLLGDKTPAEGIALLEEAYAAGVRHFDVAPYYGFGDAEKLVGTFARGKRSGITIATKFGLQPMRQTGGIRYLVGAVRKAMQASPTIRKIVQRNARYATRGGQFDIASVERSLESSLRALQTEMIDYYLLHECSLEDCTDELLGFLERAKSNGQIRQFGIGTSRANTLAICASRPAYCSIVQYKSTAIEPTVQSVARAMAPLQRGERLISTHGALTAIAPLRAMLSANPTLMRRWETEVGVDRLQDEAMAGLVLQAALRSNPGGLVLFQSSSRPRVQANIRATTERSLTAAQLDAFEKLARECQTAVT